MKTIKQKNKKKLLWDSTNGSELLNLREKIDGSLSSHLRLKQI